MTKQQTGAKQQPDSTANMEAALAAVDPAAAKKVRERAEDIARRRRRAGSQSPAINRRIG